MPDILTNLSAATRAPMVVLAKSSEFLTIESGAYAGMPTAWKTRMGTTWLGLNGTFGTVTAASVKYLGDKKETPSGQPGLIRSLAWLKPGYGLELTVHHDRGLPALRKGDRFTAWIDAGSGEPELTNFHVEEISSDQGDEDTVTMKISAEHRVGLDNLTASQLWRLEVDGNGRVISYTQALAIDAAETDPAGDLPTAPAPVSGSWAHVAAALTVTVTTEDPHGLSTGDTITPTVTSDALVVNLVARVITVTTTHSFTMTCLGGAGTTGTLTFIPPA